MQTPKEDPYILVEMGGTRKAILKEKLTEAQKMAEDMYNLAIKAGYTEEMAKELYTLRIVEEENSNPSTQNNTRKNKHVIVMMGDYPYETTLVDAPKVIEMARKAAEYFLSKGIPKEQVDRLYTTKIIENSDQQ